MVDRGGLENRCTARYRRFESYILRKIARVVELVDTAVLEAVAKA